MTLANPEQGSLGITKLQGGQICICMEDEMGFRIGTNVSSIAAQRSLQNTNMAQKSSLEKLSSGTRISRASDDAAGLAISEKMKAQMKSTSQANRNANDGISLIQTAEGGLSEASNIMIRLRELAMQSASDTVTDNEREFSNLEFQNLKEEVQRISQVTQFNGHKLLDGTGEKLDFQIGINNSEFEDRISYDAGKISISMDKLGIGESTVANKAGSQESLSALDGALQHISGQRAELGAIQNRLVSTSQNLQVTEENLSAANSRIRDTDYAKETATNAKNNILSSAGTSVLAQANSSGQGALRLLG